MQNIRRYPFSDCVMLVGLLDTGEYGARVEGGDERMLGVGHSRLSAIADLNRLLGECADWEEFDHQTARWDHARDLRKHG